MTSWWEEAMQRLRKSLGVLPDQPDGARLRTREGIVENTNGERRIGAHVETESLQLRFFGRGGVAIESAQIEIQRHGAIADGQSLPSAGLPTEGLSWRLWCRISRANAQEQKQGEREVTSYFFHD